MLTKDDVRDITREVIREEIPAMIREEPWGGVAASTSWHREENPGLTAADPLSR